MKHLLTLLSLSLLLTSCLSIDENVDLKADGSGVLTIRYRFTEELAGFGRLGDDEDTFPIPVEKERFKEGAEATRGIRYKSYSSKLKDGVHSIKGVVRFDDVDALSEFMFGNAGKVALEMTGETSSLSFQFDTRGVAVIGQNAEDMISEFFSEETVTLSVRAPAEVVSVNEGTFNGRNASITLSVPEIAGRDDFAWTVSWR